MEILKIINVYSRSGDDESINIKKEINDYWKIKTKEGEAKQFAEAFYLLENEHIGRLIISKDQAFWNPYFKAIANDLKKQGADELNYYFYKN